MKRVCLLTLTISATLFGIGLLWLVTPTVFLFGSSLALSAALRPLVARLEARRVPRGLAILVWYLLVLLGLGGMAAGYAWYFRSTVAESAATLQQSFGALVRDWQQGTPLQQALIGRIVDTLRGFGSIDGQNGLLDVGNLLLSVASGLAGNAVFVLAVLALAYYWLVEVSHFERVLLSALPPSARVRGREIWRNIEVAVGAYVRTTVIAVALAWLLLFAVYRAAGLPFAATLGLVGGLAHLVPGVGPLLGIIPAVLVALTLTWWQAVLVLVAGVGVQLLAQMVTSRLLREQDVRVNPLLQILVLLALAQIGGIGAMIFAPPLAALLQVLYANLLVVNAAERPQESDVALLQDQLHRIAAAAPESPVLAEAIRQSGALLSEAQAALRAQRR